MLTVICPVYNEEAFIKGLLDFFVGSQPEEKELVIIDGGSTDKTTTIIEQYVSRFSNITLLHNPKRFVPYALNAGIGQANGDIIVRLDAHTEYADDYFIQIIKTFDAVKADIVGGPMRAIGKNDFQKAVAYATSTPMGIGNSQFHFENYTGYTDSVYLGAWKKSIFPVTGLFDEQMKRNQDDEFHYRAKSYGFKIYQSSDIRSYYYPRSTARKLFKQYFQYGLYKPMVLRKVRAEIKLRHLIPAGFVIYVLSLIIIHELFWLIPLMVYSFGAGFFAVKCNASFPVKASVFGCYYILHIAYGLGFLLGVKNLFAKKTKVQAIPFGQTA